MRITLWTDKEVNENELAVLKALHARGFAVCVFTPDEMVNTLQEEVEDAMAEAGWREIDFHAGDNRTSRRGLNPPAAPTHEHAQRVSAGNTKGDICPFNNPKEEANELQLSRTQDRLRPTRG
jgi:hypothetical protein